MSPSTCSVPRPMILSPWPMILRSLPMTDFSPLEGGVSDRLAGDWVFGSTEALRVNMKSPDDCYTSPPASFSHPFLWLHTSNENDRSRVMRHCATRSHEATRECHGTSSTSPMVRPSRTT